jgi:PTH1 family peptidyl-tRNA hydrolase
MDAMQYLIVGLGNPGEKYEGTRHNTGRMFVDFVRDACAGDDWETETKAQALCAQGKIAKKPVLFALPETFMNKSGAAVAYLSKTKKVKPDHVVVCYDDIDLPLGTMKISFDRGSGGHRGLESVIKALKTREFVRIRFGISPSTPSGKTKKPHGDEKILNFLLGAYKKDDLAKLKKTWKKAAEALEVLVTDGKEKTMSQFN